MASPEFGLAARPATSLSDAQAQRNSRDAIAAADRAGAGKDHRRVQGSAWRTSPTCSTSSPSPSASTTIIGDELQGDCDQYGDQRRSEIRAYARIYSRGPDRARRDGRDDVPQRLHEGATGCRLSRAARGGRGKQAAGTKDDDFIDRMFIANTHDFILCFSDRGRVYWLKVYNVPQGGRVSRGKPIINLVPLLEQRKNHRDTAGQGIRRGSLRVHGDG